MEPMPTSRPLALAAVAALAACSSSPPPPLSAVNVEGAVGLFAVVHSSTDVTWHQVRADGTIAPAAVQGVRVSDVVRGHQVAADRPYPRAMTRLSPDLVLVGMGALDGPPELAYYDLVLLLDTRTGRLSRGWDGASAQLGGWRAGLPGKPPLPVLARGDGSLAVQTTIPFISPGSNSPVYAASLVGDRWSLGWPLTPVTATPTWFALDAAGNLAFDGGTTANFAPVVGPVVACPVEGPLGSFWPGSDGVLRTTRYLDDGSTSLVRLDFDAAGAVTAATTATWTGTSSGLIGRPLEMGDARVFMVDDRPVVFETPDAAPTIHPPVGITWTEIQPTSGALWFGGTWPAAQVYRWTRDGLTTVAMPDSWSAYALFPLGDDDALIGTVRTANQALAVRRYRGGVLEPVDLGPTPGLAGHVRWR
jgi:hypothetical protein